MLATFCLRLACGLTAALLLLRMDQLNPRFFRTHFLAVLVLLAVVAFFLRDHADCFLWLALGVGMALAYLNCLSWSLEETPGRRVFVLLTTVMMISSLLLAIHLAVIGREPSAVALRDDRGWGITWQLADNLTSAALLGSATTAMLVGHSYLLAPAMSLTPLLRMLAALFVCTLLRLTLALAGLWQWTDIAPGGTLEGEMALWLPLRWGLGFAAPLVLGWLAWETARIRSTQSATGILYVVVICCFLGELTSQLLWERTGLTL
jgi:hypothetical protein